MEPLGRDRTSSASLSNRGTGNQTSAQWIRRIVLVFLHGGAFSLDDTQPPYIPRDRSKRMPTSIEKS
jgi:hypothetical protein